MHGPEPGHPERPYGRSGVEGQESGEVLRLQTPTDLWLIGVSGTTLTAVSSPADEFAIGTVRAGWDATVDNDGIPWIAWSDGFLVYACRAPEGAWGPVLQVSTGTDDVQPRIIPDTYGNVWLVWWRRSASETWMCRMGPRSGQETKVASGTTGPPTNVGITEGTLTITLADGRCAVGTEHGGFTVETPGQ